MVDGAFVLVVAENIAQSATFSQQISVSQVFFEIFGTNTHGLERARELRIFVADGHFTASQSPQAVTPIPHGVDLKVHRELAFCGGDDPTDQNGSCEKGQ